MSASPISAAWGHPALEGRNRLGVLVLLVPSGLAAPTGRARVPWQNQGHTGSTQSRWALLPTNPPQLREDPVAASLRKSKTHLLGLVINTICFLPDRQFDGNNYPGCYPCAQRRFPALRHLPEASCARTISARGGDGQRPPLRAHGGESR